ncbi:MAG TPA: sulfite oxidase [Paludibaculum sp.]|jgi:DMSO/TMAO reductase YedYZ molybdopterin-dependent catalytic subunit
MALFIVRHQHDAERCPAANPEMGATLLNHLSRPNARKHGVTVQAEAIVRGDHTLYMIVECDSEARVRSYMQPFAMAGTVEVHAAGTCAGVVSAGGCGAVHPEASGAVAAMDPEQACQQAIDSGLVVHNGNPLNCETSLPALVGGVVMPNARFYVRNHFQIPRLDAATWRLKVGGLVDRPLSLSLRDLMNMPAETRVVTLECAGNGRSQLEPRTVGEQWNFGAVSTAEWTGAPLAEVLDRAGVQAEAMEVLFRGPDSGMVEGESQPIHFERSLRIEDARGAGVLLAYAMNGEPLPVQHGYPLRVIVPSWYAVASVKWLTGMELMSEPFQGHYQTDRYYFEWQRDGGMEREPLTLQRVRSLITEPQMDEEVERGELVVRGVAWSGAAPIAGVEVKANGGPWREARLVGERKRHSWQWWEYRLRVEEAGTVELQARATDMASRMQPAEPEWNRLGYGNNAIQTTRVRVR